MYILVFHSNQRGFMGFVFTGIFALSKTPHSTHKRLPEHSRPVTSSHVRMSLKTTKPSIPRRNFITARRAAGPHISSNQHKDMLSPHTSRPLRSSQALLTCLEFNNPNQKCLRNGSKWNGYITSTESHFWSLGAKKCANFSTKKNKTGYVNFEAQFSAVRDPSRAVRKRLSL